MNQQHDKEDEGGSRSNAQGGETKPKSKRIKLDDPNIQPIKRNQVDDEEALTHSSTHEEPFERKSEEPSDPFSDEVDELKMSAGQYVRLQLLQELAKKGVDIKNFNQANWKGKCRICGEVDKHPTEDCPFAEMIEF